MGKYEEALERARAGKPIDEVFPELKDEEIRNELYGFISSIQHSYLCANDRREKWLAWLERQKKQKPVHTAKEMWKEMRLEVYAQASGNRHEPNHSDDSTKMFSLRDIDEIFEKIGDSIVEPQPAEWSEEDKKFIKHCAELLDGLGEPMCAIRLESLLARSLWKPSEMQLEGGCSEKPNDLLSEQEQPEVDIKKELHTYICSDEYMNTREDGSLLIARHFYELGKNARKEEKICKR